MTRQPSASQLLPERWAPVEAILHRNPAGRGLLAYQQAHGPLCPQHFAAAVESLAVHAHAVAIVTGFCILRANPPAAETDGPPGALYLAKTLQELGCQVWLVSDSLGLPLLRAGCRYWQLDESCLCEIPFEPGPADGPLRTSDAGDGLAVTDAWVHAFFAARPQLTHLISIERCGPSHTVDSMQAQSRTGPIPLALFENEVPEPERNQCHNAAGVSIHGQTGKAYRLFELAATLAPQVTTMGIGDGGNEIGLGTLPWELLRQAIGGPAAGRIATRITTHYTLLAGISNWAGYGLALALARRLNKPGAVAWGTVSAEGELLTSLVENGAVDGFSGERVCSVDGLPVEIYLEVLAELRACLGFA